MKEKFLHLRTLAENGSYSPTWGVTAMITDTEHINAKNVSFAICNKKDTYNKVLGRAYCRDRESRGEYITLHNIKNIDELERRVSTIAEAISGAELFHF